MSIPKFWVKWLEDFYEKTKNSIFINTCSEKVAVLIEPRQHPLIKLVVHNFMYFLAPKGWSLLVVCGTDNSDFIDNELSGLNFSKLVLPFDNLIEPLYNMVLTNAGFYKSIKNIYKEHVVKHVLIFQTDTLLLKDIEEYLKFSYIGAPWKHTLHLQKGMNGGLSLRNIDEMIKICKMREYKVLDNEDGYFSFSNNDMLTNYPNIMDGMKFSVETVWYTNETPCGFHAAYKFQSHDKLEKCLKKIFDELFNNTNLCKTQSI
jgi:hypothetical protein